MLYTIQKEQLRTQRTAISLANDRGGSVMAQASLAASGMVSLVFDSSVTRLNFDLFRHLHG